MTTSIKSVKAISLDSQDLLMAKSSQLKSLLYFIS